MGLHVKEYPTLKQDPQTNADPVVILHGLMGNSVNFQKIASLIQDRRVFALDLRNHGDSPHSEDMSLDAMVDDLLQLLDAKGFDQVSLLGHSLGGKVAMAAALSSPNRVAKLIVADIAPVDYSVSEHSSFDQIQQLLLALNNMPLTPGLTRRAASEALEADIPDEAMRQFLLTNLTIKDGAPRWRVNLPVILQQLPQLKTFSHTGCGPYLGPTLFIRGERSDYILPEHAPAMQRLFPHHTLQTIPNAGHWVHAEAPKEFSSVLLRFLASNTAQ